MVELLPSCLLLQEPLYIRLLTLRNPCCRKSRQSSDYRSGQSGKGRNISGIHVVPKFSNLSATPNSPMFGKLTTPIRSSRKKAPVWVVDPRTAVAYIGAVPLPTGREKR